MLKVLDLFSGIGGFSLGLERTGGFRTVAFCEIDPFCRQVLAKHWSDVPIHEDITKLRGEDVGSVDVIAGGFPCQDISTAGRGEGIEGSRSGLWSEFARLIGEIRPRYVIVENVAALLGRGLDRVLGDLSEIGYDAEWHCIPASAVGAPHRRDRVWVVGYPSESASRWDAGAISGPQAQECRQGQFNGHLADGLEPSGATCRENDPNPPPMQREAEQRSKPDGDHAGAGDVADANEQERWRRSAWPGWRIGQSINLAAEYYGNRSQGNGHWRAEPDVGRVAHGVPARVDRLRSLGNAVVPQVVEVIGNAILEAA